MATFKKFTEIEAWQLARELNRNAYPLIKYLAEKKEFDVENQMRRSCGSIMDNIAEGFGLQGNREFIQLLTIANGSAMEFKSQLYRIFDRDFISKEKLDLFINEIELIIYKIGALIHYLHYSQLKGIKFKNRYGFCK